MIVSRWKLYFTILKKEEEEKLNQCNYYCIIVVTQNYKLYTSKFLLVYCQ